MACFWAILPRRPSRNSAPYLRRRFVFTSIPDASDVRGAALGMRRPTPTTLSVPREVPVFRTTGEPISLSRTHSGARPPVTRFSVFEPYALKRYESSLK